MSIELTQPKPYQVQADQAERRLPKGWANHRFVYVHYPEAWSFDEGSGFLPDLSTIVAKPGVNGVGKDGTLNKPIAGSLDKGGLVINATDPRLGPWKNYVGAYDCVDGKHWCFIKTEFTILPGGRVKPIDRSNEFRAFRAYLRDAQLVHPLSEPVYNQLVEIERQRLKRAGNDAARNPHLRAKYEAQEARIAAMAKAWAAYTGADSDEPIGILTPTVAEVPDEVPAESGPKRRKTIEVSA